MGVWGLNRAGCGCVGSVQQVVGVWGLYRAGCGCLGSVQGRLWVSGV